MIRDALTSYIQSDLAPILDGVVSSVDVNTLGATFTVPQLDGTGTVSVLFGRQLSSFSITTSRFLLGIGTRFTPGAIAHFRTSLGIDRHDHHSSLEAGHGQCTEHGTYHTQCGHLRMRPRTTGCPASI